MEEENEFTKGDAGSEGIERVSAGSLHKGDLVMIKDHPCRVVAFSTAKTGKHGSAKAMITGIDIFTANKYECTFSTGDNVDAPVCKRSEYTLINIEDDGFVSLMSENGDIKEDLKLPEDEWLKDVTEKIREIFEDGTKECTVTVLGALGTEKIIAVREGKEQ
jgi:translation initiation factor 5A